MTKERRRKLVKKSDNQLRWYQDMLPDYLIFFQATKREIDSLGNAGNTIDRRVYYQRIGDYPMDKPSIHLKLGVASWRIKLVNYHRDIPKEFKQLINKDRKDRRNK